MTRTCSGCLLSSLHTATRLLLSCLLFLPLVSSPTDARQKTLRSPKEIRGVWIHPSLFGTGRDTSIANMQRTLDSYRRAGINTLMLLVKSTSGLVCYRSNVAPVDPSWNWDFVGTFLAEARNRGMVVHPWFCIFTEGAKAGVFREHPEWLIQSKSGESLDVANPSLKEVRSYEISVITEFVRLYDVKWIHCDYVRYPCSPSEPLFSYDRTTREMFKLRYGEDPSALPQTNSGNMLWNEWIEWDGEQVTTFMRELKQSLKSNPRTVKISAAVFPDAAISKVLIGQDWARWARERLVDMFCPMLYTNDNALFVKYLKRGLVHAGNRAAVCAGIGIVSAHNKNEAAGIVRQIQRAKREKAQGFVLFSAFTLTKEVLDGLRSVR